MFRSSVHSSIRVTQSSSNAQIQTCINENDLFHPFPPILKLDIFPAAITPQDHSHKMGTTQSPTTRYDTAANQTFSLDEFHQIVRAKADVYFACLPGPDKWSEIDQMYPTAKKKFGDPKHPAAKARGNTRHHVELRRLLQGAVFKEESLKHFDSVLDYRLGAILEVQKYISILPFLAPKIAGFDTGQRLRTTLFTLGACPSKQMLFWKAYNYIERSQLLTTPAWGEGWTFEKPIQHLALILAKKYNCRAEILHRIKALKDLSRCSSQLPPRRVPDRQEIILQNRLSWERRKKDWVKACFEDWEKLYGPESPTQKGKGS